MKNALLTIVLVFTVATVSFGVLYVISDRPAVRRAAAQKDAMAWLRAEFHLNDAQFAAIRKLHENFGAVCALHCQAIADARESSGSPQEIARLEAVCIASMVDHFHKVAALMPPREGDRYLAIVLPRIEGYGHAAPPTIGVRG